MKMIFGGRAYKINGVDMTKLRLIKFNVQVDTFGSNDDKVKDISWRYDHNGFSGSITDIFLALPLCPSPSHQPTHALSLVKWIRRGQLF